MASRYLTISIVALLVLLVAVPLSLPAPRSGEERFGGTDDKAQTAIAQMNPQYKPWFQALWSPPSAEVESLLFSLQAAGGAALVGYALGFARGRSLPSPRDRGDQDVPH